MSRSEFHDVAPRGQLDGQHAGGMFVREQHARVHDGAAPRHRLYRSNVFSIQNVLSHTPRVRRPTHIHTHIYTQTSFQATNLPFKKRCSDLHRLVEVSLSLPPPSLSSPPQLPSPTPISLSFSRAVFLSLSLSCARALSLRLTNRDAITRRHVTDQLGAAAQHRVV